MLESCGLMRELVNIFFSKRGECSQAEASCRKDEKADLCL